MAKTLEEITADYEVVEQKMKAAKERIAELEREKGLGGFSQDCDEKRLLRTFRCGNIKQLLEKNVAEDSFRHVPITDKLAVIELKKEIDIARWYAQIFEGAPMDRGELEKSTDIARVKIFGSQYAKESDLQNRLKAFGTDVSGAGAEWIETMVSSSFVDEYLLEKRVANAFVDIQMPSNPFKLPVKKSGTTAKIIAEGSAATGNNFGTDALTFDAANKLFELYNLPEELNEDSAIAFLSLGRQEVIDAQVKAIETAILNGNSGDTGVAADAAEKCWNGLRKKALDNSANGAIVTIGAAVSATKLDEMLAEGGKFTINPREAIFIVSPQISHQMSALPEVTSVEKFGPLATILTGYLSAYRGRGIVVSEFMREDLAATGLFDNVTKTKGGLLLVNKTRFYLGHRRPIRVRVAADARAEYDRYQLVSYQRADFQGIAQNATEKSVIYGINVTL